MDEELQALEAELAQLRAAVNAPATPTATQDMRPAVATGGLLNLGDILTFGQLSKGIAAVPAIGRDLYGLATGAEPQDYYSQELAKVNALKDLYAAERERQGLSGLETALSFMAPVPAGKAEALMSVARPLKEAGLGLAAYGGSELGEATIGGTGGAITGALAAPSLLFLGKAGMRAIAPSLKEGGKGLQRTSLGIRQSDYTKETRNQIIESLPSDFETTLKNSADRLVENKTLGTSTNPNVLYANLRDAKESTEGAIQGVLQSVDKTRKTGIIPRLDKTLDWIQTKAPATEVKYYKEKVNEFLKALKEQGQGSLVYLNQQKKAVGENWKQSPETDPTFWRRFYTDIKDTIEEYAPQVKQLNKDKRDLLVIEPIIERTKRASEKGMTPQDLTRALLYTTGGAGLPGAAYLMGSPILGTALAGGLALAGTKPGQSLLGRALTATGRAGQELEATPLLEQASRLGYFGARGVQQAGEQAPVSSAAIPTATPTEDTEIADLEAELESLRQMLPKQEAKVGKQEISIPTGKQYAPASLVKAVMKVESGGKQEAVSSKGARGLMQLMPATARDLGVDAKDPKQNVEGGSRYLQQQLMEFGDESLALAAYNWGPNNIKRVMAKVRAEGKRPTWTNIKAYVKVPKETREYVDKVLSLV
jgi:soluble lytic murein transglycosylase-like protein